MFCLYDETGCNIFATFLALPDRATSKPCRITKIGSASFTPLTFLKTATKSYTCWCCLHAPSSTYHTNTLHENCLTNKHSTTSQILSISSNNYRGTKSKLETGATIIFVSRLQKSSLLIHYFTTWCDPSPTIVIFVKPSS